ncbi:MULTISPECIES: zinc-binding alcohol dehydrogenase [unclassified Microbacterium]|uniref:zinc-binding alcohol dehydrogenase n=1 Tax=unclassified Microbacterium TaxID=2609290 RepID=UPI00364C510C
MVDKPQWLVREEAGIPVLVALALRQRLGIRTPAELPTLRDHPLRAFDDAGADDALERQWRAYWDMTVEPETHPSAAPLELIHGFDTIVALPAVGAERLRAAIAPLAAEVVRYANEAQQRYSKSVSGTGDPYRAYAAALAEFERDTGRRAHSFELNVHVLPLAQRGIWRIGAFSIAVTDSLRHDPVDFDSAIRPVIAEVA